MKLTTFPGGAVLVDSEDSTVMIDPARSGPFYRRFPDWGDLAESRDFLLTGASSSANKDAPVLLEALDGTAYCSEETAAKLEKHHGNPDRIAIVRPGIRLIIDGLTVLVCEGESESVLSFEITDGTDTVTVGPAVPMRQNG